MSRDFPDMLPMPRPADKLGPSLPMVSNDCAAVGEMLSLYALTLHCLPLGPDGDDALTKAEQAQVQHHVQVCTACASELAELRELMTALHDHGQLRRPTPDAAFWHHLHGDIVAATAPAKAAQRWWQRPRTRWAGGLAMAAALAALFASPVTQLLDSHAPAAVEAVDARSLLGSAKEAVANDRAFVDDLAASDDDPADLLDELDDLDDVDLDALGTALDDEPAAGQGA